MVIDDQIARPLRDHQLTFKLQDFSGAIDVRPNQQRLLRRWCEPRSLGAVGIDNYKVIADFALSGRMNMTTGAAKSWHYRSVSIERDIDVDDWAICLKCVREKPALVWRRARNHSL